ncbi:MAG: hydroxymethylglutaryl-CoA lyase [Candidatus Paracaedibacteraceae bacterium]|nr:hydroxymethylglutaryl-CoA lyase [Candidatus Paracaedibacteraceae bacterium]
MIRIVEVGPRDGLQNEKRIWTIDERVQLINLLSQCGFSEIEVGSFVSPKWVPQMAGTDEVFRSINKNDAIRYSALVPNDKGMEAALRNGVRTISIFTAASEAFTKKNINCSIDESFDRFSPIMALAKQHNISVRGYVSCVVACPYAGDIAPESTAEVADRLYNLGCSEISLGDTIGKGTPESIQRMIQAVSQQVPLSNLAIHCHDTYGTALANIETALASGIKTIDSAITGLGGCPYGGETAKGNVATEKVLDLLDQLGYQHSLIRDKIEEAATFVRKISV